ncbi:MAG: AI-2E family transporter, partial [Bacteroidia bacterium]|nr:AI-2E family transporter [Bacteroidia bacterium]
MNSKMIANGILRAFAILIGVTLLLYFFYKIQSVIIYLAIAAVVSLIARPIIIFLRSKLKFANTLAVIVTMFLFILFVFGLISMFIPLIIKQGQNLSLLDINQLEYNIENLLGQVNAYFSEKGINIFEQLKSVDILSRVQAI